MSKTSDNKIEWPPDRDRPSPAHVLDTAIELCGNDYIGKSMARAAAAILLHAIYVNVPRQDQMTWASIERKAGQKEGTLVTACHRNFHRPVSRKLALMLMGHLLQGEGRGE